MTALPAIRQTASRKGDISALWWNANADAGAQDATAALLSSSSASFRFGDDAPKWLGLKAASALPRE
jgi:hypothetical protein